MMQHYENTLPDQYTEARHINAADKKLGLILNIAAIVILAATMGIGMLPVLLYKGYTPLASDPPMYVSFIILGVGLIAYIVLHEIVHGIAYKAFTKQKLTFGISWSCAFCGVPHIYVYRSAALVALLAPFVSFSLLLLPLSVGLYFVNPMYYMPVLFILGMHLGGCSGDLYMTYLLHFKYKSKDTLIRDTGPEQFIYTREQSNCPKE